MIKNIFIISSILLFLVLVFYGIYNFTFDDLGKLKKSETEKTNQEKTEKNLKDAENNKIVAITDEPVIGAALSSDGERIRFYNKDSGNVVDVSFDGSIRNTIFENDLKDLLDVVWSPDRKFVISSFGDNLEKKFYLYSYITRKSVELKQGIEHVIWNNQGDKIIYKYFNENSKERSINISRPNGKEWRKLVDLNDKFRKVSFAHVPQTLFVSYWNYPDSFSETSLNKISLLEERDNSSQELLRGRFGANYLWSPNGRKLLVSSVEKGSNKLKLEIGDVDSGDYRDLMAPTLTDKCIWLKDNKSVLCAMPSKIPDGSVMPNDYQDKKIFTKDTFWKIDTENGKKERIVELENLEEEYDASKLILSPKENLLFFTNRLDDKIYMIVL